MATDYKFRITAQDKTKGAFNSVNKSVNGTQKAMKKLAGAFAGAFAVSKLVQFTNESMKLADEVGKTADKLGVTTDFLQKMQFAAEQTGIATNTLNMGLQRFTRRVAEARNGTGEAKAALEQLGIALNDSAGNARSIDDILADVSDGLANTADSGEKVRLAFKFFDSEGVALVSTLGQGSEALKLLTESATGVIPEQTIRDAERFNDAMNRLQRQVLTPLRNKLIEIATAFLDVGEAMGLIDPEPQLKSLDELNTDYEALQRSIVATTLSLRDNTRADEDAIEIRKELRKQVTADIKERDKLLKTIQKVQKAQEIRTIPTTLVDEDTTKKIKDNITIVKSFADTVEGQLTNAFTDFFDFASDEFKDFGKLAESITRAVINELINVFIVQKAVGMVKGMIGNIQSGFEYNKLTDGDTLFKSSNEGGGFTGMGVRAGGIDGRGGFPAILHPNETVVDHTKGQGASPTVDNTKAQPRQVQQASPTVNFNIQAVDAAGFDELLSSRKGLITSIINNAMNNQGKMGVV